MKTIIAYQPNNCQWLFKSHKNGHVNAARDVFYFDGIGAISHLYSRRSIAAKWIIKLKEPN